MSKELAHYPEDRGEIFGEPNEEEAHFYFVLNDFTDLLDKYGVDYVMTRLRYPEYMKLFNYFEEL
jgi:hypothetical protein